MYFTGEGTANGEQVYLAASRGNDPLTFDEQNGGQPILTKDFVTFSEAKVWVDPGYSVIDSTVIEDGDTYYRFTKDERSPDGSNPMWQVHRR